MSLIKKLRPQRGYLLNTYTNVRYTFQYNPEKFTDSKSATWDKREGVSPRSPSGSPGQTASSSTLSPGKSSAEQMARRFSKADFQKFNAEGERSLTLEFTIDGREPIPGEDWRRNPEGDLLSDIAFLRSLVYPKAGKSLKDILQRTSGQVASSYSEEWFNEPPTVILSLGNLTMEAYVTKVDIEETLFNAQLSPMLAKVTMNLKERVDSYSVVMDAINRLRRSSHRATF